MYTPKGLRGFGSSVRTPRLLFMTPLVSHQAGVGRSGSNPSVPPIRNLLFPKRGRKWSVGKRRRRKRRSVSPINYTWTGHSSRLHASPAALLSPASNQPSPDRTKPQRKPIVDAEGSENSSASLPVPGDTIEGLWHIGAIVVQNHPVCISTSTQASRQK